MKLCFLSVLLFFFTLVAAAANLEEIINLNTAATGGKEAIEKVESTEIHLTIQEPEFTVEGIYIADRKARMRIDIYAGGKRVFTEAFDGKNGWRMGEDGKVKDTSGEGKAALRNGIFLPGKLFGLHELPALGHKIAYEGRQTVENISYHVLKLILDSGMETFFYIHPDTGYIERTRDVKALHPDMDPTKKATEAKNSDFRKIEGVVRSFQAVRTDLKTGKIVQTTTVKEVKINPKLDESKFLKPS